MRRGGKLPIKTEMSNDLKWEARDYARTLAAAEDIKSNPQKLALAKIGANEILNERTNELRGLKAVASGKSFSSDSDITDKRGYVNPATISKM